MSKTAEDVVRSQELVFKGIADKSLIWNAYNRTAKRENPRQAMISIEAEAQGEEKPSYKDLHGRARCASLIAATVISTHPIAFQLSPFRQISLPR